MSLLEAVFRYSPNFGCIDAGQLQTLVHTTPFIILLDYIYYLPYSWRKLLLDASRIQRPITGNQELRTRYLNISDRTCSVSSKRIATQNSPWFRSNQKRGRNSRHPDKSITLEDVIELFDNLYESSALCSLLSYFLRAEKTAHLEQFLAVNEELKIKEYTASIERNIPQQLNYSYLFTENPDPVGVHTEYTRLPTRLRAVFRKSLERFRTRSTRELILPFYNPRKNIGYQTQVRLDIAMGGDGNLPMYMYTTRDLLLHYMRTGEQIGGPLELRSGWKVNDLKGRVYYCLGGDGFWPALYIKPVASALQSLIPTTDTFTRFEVKRISQLGPDQILVTYDYSSFTTSLAELKYFLWYLATSLEGVEVYVLDVHSGIQILDLGKVLHQYNEAININQEVDVCRLMQGILDYGVDSISYQGRSGSLGVQGNIGFSTINHGISISAFTDTPDEDSCVGDDALVKTYAELLITLLGVVNKLGVVNPDKVAQLRRPYAGDNISSGEQQFKYLKRPLNVDHDGRVVLGRLDDFPSLAEMLFPEGDEYHSHQEKPLNVRVQMFVTQWGRFLHRNYQTPDSSRFLFDEELLIIMRCIQSVYKAYGLPLEGSFGRVSYHEKDEVHIRSIGRFPVPPADTLDVFSEDWLEMLYSRFNEVLVTIPVRAGGSVPPPEYLAVGDSFEGTSTPILVLMCDLGFLKQTENVYTTMITEDIVEVYKRDFYSGDTDPILYTYDVLDVPHWYDSVYRHLFAEELSSDYDFGYARSLVTTYVG